MKRRKQKNNLRRDWMAVKAHFMNSAGSMKDKLKDRKIVRRRFREQERNDD